MNINGIITKEELDNVIAAYLKTHKTTKRIYLIGKIFWVLYALLLLFLLFCTFYIKNGLTLLAFLFCALIAFDSLKNNFKTTKLLKPGAFFKNTDKALSYPEEYRFSIDNEKVTVNDKISVPFSDVVMSAVYNDYTVLVGKEKLPVVVQTDLDSQWQIFELLKSYNKPGFIITGGKKEFTGNEKIMEYSRTVAVKTKQKKKRKVLLLSVVLATAGRIGMYIIGSMNNQSARDNNTYSYDEGANVYFISQMAEKYAETESYKSLLDIYFDWAAKDCKSVVAVKTVDGIVINMDILFKDEYGTPNYVRYTNAPEKDVMLIDFPFAEGIAADWNSEVKKLSNYQYLAEKYPYIVDIFSVIGIDLELVLKDKYIHTLHDHMYIFLTPAFYSCGSEEEDYYYVVSVSEKDVDQPDKLLDYFTALAEKVNKSPYDEGNIDMNEIKSMLVKHCKVSMAEDE